MAVGFGYIRLGNPKFLTKEKEEDMRIASLLPVVMCLATVPAMAQDPVKVDSKHYKVEFENARVRVLRINYGPHEKSVMHDHPASVAVFLTDEHGKFTLADGKTEESHKKAGETEWTPAGKHLPENLSDKPMELILVELKGKAAAAKPATRAPAKKPS